MLTFKAIAHQEMLHLLLAANVLVAVGGNSREKGEKGREKGEGKMLRKKRREGRKKGEGSREGGKIELLFLIQNRCGGF